MVACLEQCLLGLDGLPLAFFWIYWHFGVYCRTSLCSAFGTWLAKWMTQCDGLGKSHSPGADLAHPAFITRISLLGALTPC